MAASSATDAASDTGIRNIVIAGGGIIGTSVAYYLIRDHLAASKSTKVSLKLVDPTGTVGSCASGKAGGFLARDWRDGTPLQELQQKGFDLHQELAEVFGSGGKKTKAAKNPTDYRRLTCATVAVDEKGIDDDDNDNNNPRIPNKPPSKKLIDLEWVDPDVVLWGEDEEAGVRPSTGGGAVIPMGDEETIAQVHPRKLCETMWESIASKNKKNTGVDVELVEGKIVRATTTNEPSGESMSVTGVELEDGSVLEADVLVVACGPWTYEANRWFAAPATDDNNTTSGSSLAVLPDITAVKCHSILVPSARGKPNTQAVFFDSNGAIGAEGDLEVYPRPDGDSYVNGFANPEGRCLEKPGHEQVEDDKIELLRSAMDFVEKCGASGDSESESAAKLSDEPFERPTPRDHTQQVCYWPETPDGLPLIGKIPAIGGTYVAAGHSVWGILQGPATGKALAELIVTGKSECVDLSSFGVERYYQ